MTCSGSTKDAIAKPITTASSVTRPIDWTGLNRQREHGDDEDHVPGGGWTGQRIDRYQQTIEDARTQVEGTTHADGTRGSRMSRHPHSFHRRKAERAAL